MTRSLRGIRLVCGAALLLLLASGELVLASSQAGMDGSTAITAELTSAKNALVAERNIEQMANGAPYVDTEVAYVIRELTVASDVSFLGFDCAIILPASSSAEEMLNLSSTEQVNATPANRRTFTAPVVADNNLVSTEQGNNLVICDTMNSAVFDTGI